MKVAFLIDPIHTLNPDKDTSIAMMHSAISQGCECYAFTVSDMYSKGGQVVAFVSALIFSDEKNKALPDIGLPFEKALSDFDIILMRKDPPFNMEYLYATYALDLVAASGTIVSNNPQSLRDANEKFFILQFDSCIPRTIVTKNKQILHDFWQSERAVIFKPLSGMGGDSVFYVGPTGDNLSVILETLTHDFQTTIMAQQYIPNIHQKGDKRIILINGQPIPYALKRIPQHGELRANLAAGGYGEVVEITEHDRFICKTIAPRLQAMHLDFVGIDVIDEYLTEINVTSPTCAREIMRVTGLDITGQYVAFLMEERKKVTHHSSK